MRKRRLIYLIMSNWRLCATPCSDAVMVGWGTGALHLLCPLLPIPCFAGEAQQKHWQQQCAMAAVTPKVCSAAEPLPGKMLGRALPDSWAQLCS